MSTLVTVIVLFCASGTGIYDSIVFCMTEEHSILIAKSVHSADGHLLIGDGSVFDCYPQTIWCTADFSADPPPAMINDFKAAGGFLLLAIGFRMIKVNMFPTAVMIPAMVLVMPLSWFWTSYILPLVG